MSRFTGVSTDWITNTIHAYTLYIRYCFICLNLLKASLTATCHREADSLQQLLTALMFTWQGGGGGENRYTDASANIHVHTSCNISSVIFFLLLFCFLTWSYLFTCLPVACSRLLLVCRSALTKAHSLLAERKKIISPLFCHHRLRKGRQETWERRMTCNKVLEMSRCQNYKATNYRSSAALLQWGGG